MRSWVTGSTRQLVPLSLATHLYCDIFTYLTYFAYDGHNSPMEQSSYTLAFEYALNQLEQKLPGFLTYHSYFHTVREVLPVSRRLAQECGVPDEDLQLLELAAVYHDIGYLHNIQEHEQASAKVAQEVLPGFGLSKAEIETITSMILATRLPAKPTTLLEKILADADLFVLGGEDFFNRSEDLRRELSARGQAYPLKKWYEIQLAFMEEHAYFTPVAAELCGEHKRRNIQELKRLLAELKD